MCIMLRSRTDTVCMTKPPIQSIPAHPLFYMHLSFILIHSFSLGNNYLWCWTCWTNLQGTLHCRYRPR